MPDADSPVFIEGFSLAGYRSFGPTIQRIGPLAKINLFAGPNNSGKSNILKFVKTLQGSLSEAVGNSGPDKNDTEDSFRHSDENHSIVARKFGMGFSSLNGTYPLNSSFRDKHQQAAFLKSLQGWLMSVESMRHGTELTWIDLVSKEPGEIWRFDERVSHAICKELEGNWLSSRCIDAARELGESITRYGDGSHLVEAMNPIMRLVIRLLVKLPLVHDVPAKRNAHATDADVSNNASHDGRGLIKKLAELQNPKAQHVRESGLRFRRINEFVQNVTGKTSATLQIPFDASTINVTIDGRTFELASLGTGIHEVIILAAVAITVSDSIVCVEEPEIHLNPILQRKLVRFLAEKTANQYFIATHSAHILDIDGAAVFHVSLENGQTTVKQVTTASDRWEICRELGYRASDLVQTNCVIWVEGPSDRTYLLKWLAIVSPELVERIHFSIMFYGGRLLSHLAADDPEVDEFISLRRLNRNVAVLMDSDRKDSEDAVNETKTRIVNELAADGFAWITDGREVENYVDPERLKAAITEVHDIQNSLCPGQYDKILDEKAIGKKPDKVKIAKAVQIEDKDLDRFDLRAKLVGLVDFIRKANH